MHFVKEYLRSTFSPSHPGPFGGLSRKGRVALAVGHSLVAALHLFGLVWGACSQVPRYWPWEYLLMALSGALWTGLAGCEWLRLRRPSPATCEDGPS